jgi:hypothetical protein
MRVVPSKTRMAYIAERLLTQPPGSADIATHASFVKQAICAIVLSGHHVPQTIAEHYPVPVFIHVGE